MAEGFGNTRSRQAPLLFPQPALTRRCSTLAAEIWCTELVAAAPQALVVAHHHDHFENRGSVDAGEIESDPYGDPSFSGFAYLDKTAQRARVCCWRRRPPLLLRLQRHELTVPDHLGALEAPGKTYLRVVILQLAQQHKGVAGLAQIRTEDSGVAAQRSGWHLGRFGSQSRAAIP
jgi:hypothetical protein